MRTDVRRAFAVIVVTCAAGLPADAGSPSAVFSGLGDLPGGETYSTATAVSPDGTTVVGWSRGPDPGVPGLTDIRAFRWTVSEGLTELADPGNVLVFNFPYDVSGDGSTIVGGCVDTSNSFATVPCYWTPTDGLIEIVDTNALLTGFRAFGVSADGSVIVGSGQSATSGVAWRWTEATSMQSLAPAPPAILDSLAFGVSADGTAITGQVIVELPDAGPFHWTEATGLVPLGDVPGGVFYSIGNAISPDGSTIVGLARNCNGTCDEAFLWTEAGGFVLLDLSHGADGTSSAEAATADEFTVFGWKTGVGATVWDAQHGLRSLQDVLASAYGLDVAGWTLTSAVDCTPDGLTIVGTGMNPEGNWEGWVVRLQLAGAVPAASDWGLVLLGISTLIGGTLIQRRTACA